MSPVEQIALTVNIALRRDASTLDYYRTGSSPDAFATLPKEWTADQIRSFQDYFDALMSGNLARRRQTKFMPADFKLIEARQPPLKDQYDEWLARIICYAFSVPVSPFVSQVNRATGETMRQQATQEGLVPLKAWVKNALDHVIRECMNEPGLEFVWVGDDAVDPLEQAQTLQILVGAGIKTREEARADLGLGPTAAAAQRLTNAVASADATRPCERRPQRFRGIEQKENIFLTAYVGFPVAPTFMIWSSDLGSGWIRWPHDSTALWTPIIPDDATRSHRRHWSREANGLPSVPRRSSNRRRLLRSPDSNGSNTQSAWLLSRTGVLDSNLRRLAQIEIFRVVIKSAPWSGSDDLTWDVVDDYASYIHGLARICGSDVVGNVEERPCTRRRLHACARPEWPSRP